MIDKNTIQQLREIPIESVALWLNLNVHRHKCLCPFHADRNPSGSFSARTNRFRCFSCNATADTISLTQHVLGVGFREACELLLRQQGHIVEQHPPRVKSIKRYPPDVDFLRGLMRIPIINNEAAHFLYDERHYSPKVVKWLGLSSISQPTPCWRYGRPFYDAPSLLLPYKDMEGNIVNVQSRLLVEQEGKPRFLFPPNGSVNSFNLPILKLLAPDSELWLCEGGTDVIAHLSARHFAIGIPGAYNVKPDDLACLPYFVRERNVTLHCAADNDRAGNDMFETLSRVCTQLELPLVRHKLPTGCKDFSNFYVRNYNLHIENFHLPIY